RDALDRFLEVEERGGDRQPQVVLALAAEDAERAAVERGHVIALQQEALQQRRRAALRALRRRQLLPGVDGAEAAAGAGDVGEDVERRVRPRAVNAGDVVER